MTAQARVTVFAGTATMLVALSLTPVYATSTWFWHSLGAVIVIGLVGAGMRRASAPSAVTILVQLLSIFIYLGWLYSDDMIFGLIPGPGAIQDLGSLLRSGLADADTYAPKVPETTGLLLLTVGGVALVDLAVDAAAATFRRASLAGLPLLALYTVPASILEDGIPWPLFLLGALGYIGLLIAEGQERLVRWGRPLVAGLSAERAGRAGSPSKVDTTPFGQVGRRIGAVVITTAIIVPALLPITDGLLTSGAGGLFGGTGSGDGGTRIRIDPLVTMRRNFRSAQDTEVARLATSGNVNPANLYLRMATLDVFDGTEWKPSQPLVDKLADNLARPSGLSEEVDSQRITTRVDLTTAFESYYLPVPYPLSSLDIDGSWGVERNTQNIISNRGPNQVSGRSYVANSLVLSPTPAQLADAPAPPIDFQRRYTELPEGLPSIVGELANQAVAGASTPYDKALRLQDWLRSSGDFTYSTDPGREGTGVTAIEAFLSDRIGYCEQFAATMAVMARYLGIPARVNVGFSAGEQVDANTISVSTHDAHAWPELYFEGAGWVRFEPTPFALSRGAPPSYVAAPNAEQATEAPPVSPTSNPTDTPTGGSSAPASAGGSACPLPRPELCDVTGDQPGAGGADSGTWQLVLAIIAGALLLGSVPALLRVGIRRRRWRLAGTDPAARADVAWLELLDSARDLGYARQDSDTPRQTAARLIKDAKLRARHQEPLQRLTNAVERSRYARNPAADSGLQEDLAAVRGGLATRAGRAWQVRAVLLPRSTWDVAHWVAERIADVLDAIDRAATWVSRRVLRTGRGETTG
ncbi:MAG TPA: transglutaminaseTgpA domain-containing protein [Actinomycetes bacterium]|nr:transglutaminaseTgpA domain-containing protein [Actinomycetes bacterium]